MGGWRGKILRVNLTKGTSQTEALDPKLARAYVGGRGLGTKILYDEIDPAVDPLSPRNPLILATGPLTGTNAPTEGRYMVITKSPLTGAIAAATGRLLGRDEFCGTTSHPGGRAKTPVYLWLNNGTVEIRPPRRSGEEHPRDRGSAEADHPRRRSAIGPAGRSALTARDQRQAPRGGRSGVGAVMGRRT
jgi:aldehyde:ferredoxin oxidoreductase